VKVALRTHLPLVALSSSIAAALGMLAPSEVEAAEPVVPAPPAHRISYDQLTGARLNPLGLEARYNLGVRSRLYEHDSVVLRDNSLGLVANSVLSPAMYRFGASLEVKPLTLLTLSAGVHRVGYLGTFQFLQGFPNARADYADSSMREATARGENYATGGTEVELRATAVAKVGPVAIRSDTSAFHTDVDLRAGQTVYYSIRYDLLMPDGGFALVSDNDVVYVSDFGLLAGVRASVGASFLDEAQRAGREDVSPTFRVGPTVGWVFFDEPGTRFNKPTVLLSTGWWLQHPYRAGQDVSQALPTIQLAFRYEGEFWRTDD
jgi:hypothetical protein